MSAPKADEPRYCVCGHILGSPGCCNFGFEDLPALCLRCGREMSTEDAIRSDFCPECDPPKARAEAGT